MSAFLVSDMTINHCLMAVAKAMTYEMVGDVFVSSCFLETQTDLNALGAAMLNMNQRALSARYGGEPDESHFRFALPKLPISDLQLFKSLECLLYQCAEGDVPEEPLFEALKDAHGKLGKGIIHALPEWDAAKWGA